MPQRSNAPIPKYPIAYYITAHGYGHGARSCDILRALLAQRTDMSVVIVSDLDPQFLASRLSTNLSSELAIANPDEKFPRLRIRRGAFDIGMVQLDSVRVDLDATLERGRALMGTRADLVRQEAAFLRDIGARVVVADIPSLPLEASAEAGVPSVAVGNFGWDWIYEEFADRDPDWRNLSLAMAEGYARADLLLRLPFAEPMRAFRRKEDVPLVARAGHPRREELARLTGARTGSFWSLLSFTTLDLDDAALDRIEALADYEFFTVLPLAWKRRNIHAVDRRVMPYVDVMASVDAVITKPGFGVLSECVANRKPIIYTERTDFREYDVLVASMKKYLRNVHLPGQQLYRGELRGALDAIQTAPEPREKLESGGDLVAARRILAMADA